MDTPFLSVIIPAYNEEGRIGPTITSLIDYLSQREYSWEILVVDDGSTDSTSAVVRQYTETDGRVRLIEADHAGKGWTVRRGMLAAAGRYRLMCDADLSMPVHHVADFLDRMAEGYDVVIGSRQITGARRIGEPARRHVMGRVFNFAVHVLAVGKFQDTQCGFKCFTADASDTLFGLQLTRGWGFDVEILYLAVKHKMRILEMPIEWRHEESSKINPFSDSLQMVRDTAVLRWRDLRGRYRGRPRTADR